MALDICHTILLQSAHFILWIRLYLWTIIWRFMSKPFSLLIGNKLSVERCRADSKNLPKIPSHIGLQILENKISEEDVASLLMWCIAMGFPFISLFDNEGYLKRDPTRLRRIVQEKLTGVSESNDLGFQIETPVRNEGRNYELAEKDASLASCKTRIALMSCEDGRVDFTDSARQLCQDVADKRYKATEIGIPHLDQVMNSILDYPDPDLIIQFGCVNSLLGYSPWKIRVTEILSVPTHHSIDYQSFLNLLQSYSRTQQRFGK